MDEKWANKVEISGIAGRVRCEPGWSFDAAWANRLPDFDLWFVWEGRGQLRASGREVALRPGTCLWMRPGGDYEAVQDLDNRLGVSFVHFVVRDEPGFTPPFEVTDVRSVDFVGGMLAEVVRWVEEDRVLAERLLGDLLRVLVRDHGQTQPGGGERGGGLSATRRRREQEMRTLATRIMEEPGRAWQVGGQARELGMAPDHFSRVFAEVLGERPQAFVVRQRMLRARQLLLESHLPVGEVAHLLGFRDVFYFSRQFRAFAGMPPSELRRRAGR